MATPTNIARFAWVVTIKHTSATFRVATKTLNSAAAVSTLGGFYTGRITNNFSVRRQMPDLTYGIDIPTLSSPIILDNGDSTFDPSLEWRETPCVVRKYDIDADTATTRFTGIIIDAYTQGTTFVITLGSQLDAIFDQLIPSYVVSAAPGEFPTSTDAGRCIPKVYGRSVPVQCPYIAVDTSSSATSAGGHDFVATWGDGGKVEKVYSDFDRLKPGLESLSIREDAPGSPTYAGTPSFTVSGSLSLEKRYRTGRILRFKTTAGGDDWQYTHVTGYTAFAGTPSAGTVTVADAILDAGLSSMQLDADYIIETDRYAIDGSYLTTLRFAYAPGGGVLAVVSDATLENPIDVIQDILTDDDYGLSQTGKIDTTTFTAAADACTAAGLGSAVAGALGWDGAQRKARDVITELLAFRGGRLLYDGDSEKFKAYVDSTPSAATLALRFAQTTGSYAPNSVYRVEQPWRKQPLRSCIKSLTLRYAQGGRASGSSANFMPSAYHYEMTATGILTVGQAKTVASPWIRSHAIARRWLGYRRERLSQSDASTVVVAGPEFFDVSLGDLITYTNPLDGLAGTTVQVWGIEERLEEIALLLVGYSANIYADTGQAIGSFLALTNGTDVTLDEQTPRPGTSSNRLTNPDFSTGFKQANPPVGTQDTDSLPGVAILDTSGALIDSMSITTDFGAVGSHVLSVVVTGTYASIQTHTPRLAWYNTIDGNPGGISVVPNEPFFFSIYSDKNIGWRIRVLWIDSGGNLIRTDSPALSRTGEINGKGWYRYYSSVRAPSTENGDSGDAVYAYPEVLFLAAQTTQFDAAQFEMAQRGSFVPSVWKRNIQAGLDPGYVTSGDLLLRAAGTDPEAGTKIRNELSAVTSLSGASVNILNSSGGELIPAGCKVKGVLFRVVTSITFGGGGSTVNIGTAVDPTAWGSELAYTTAGDVSDDGDATVGVVPYKTATHVVLTPDTGTFAGGSVQAVISYEQTQAPSV